MIKRIGAARLDRLWLCLCVFVIVFTIGKPLYEEFREPSPQAVRGLLDLRDRSFGDADYVRLNGEWEFYWNALLEPGDFAGGAAATLQPERITVPSSWDSIAIGGQRLPDSGYATYRLRILVPEQHGVFGIKTSNIRASNRIFVNGEQIGHSGEPDASPERIEHRNTPYTGYFKVDGREIEIVVQVASYKSFNSGIVQAISFGNQRAISALNNYNIALDGVLAGGFITVAIYFLGIFFQRRSHKELLFFGLCSIATVAFVLTHSERLLMQMFPAMSIEVGLYISDISAILMFSLFARYVYHSFPHLYPLKVLRAVEGVAAVNIAAVLFTTASYNGPYILFLVFLVMGVMLLNCFYMGKAAWEDKEGSSYLYIGILGTLDYVVVNFLNNIWKLEANYFLPVALPIIILSQALYMSRQYTKSYRTIQDLSAKLTTLDKLKDEFLANTSHELKTPLNGIINISQSLLAGAGGEVNRSQASDLKLVVDTGKRLSTLVNDILDYSKMKNRDLQLRTSHFDSCMVIGVVVEMVGHSIRNSALKLVNAVPEGRFFVNADENRFTQIVYNLIDNAVKYTAEGRVEISASRAGGHVYFTVADTGIGVAPERIEDIFKSFEQLEPSLTRTHGGVGLGLTITQQLVELHGGTIRVESEPGAGSKFIFSVPAGSASQTVVHEPDSRRWADIYGAQAQAEVAAAVQQHPGDGAVRILAVDDEYSSLKAITNLLTVEKYTVTTATNGEEALKALMSGGSFDLCILDVMMPGLSGYEVCRQIRAKYSLLELPVLLVTAKNQYHELAAGFAAGANDYLEKPYDHVELINRVGTLVQLKRSSDELVRKELSFLQAQIKPHFIYNTLNTILSFSYTDHQRSRKLLNNFGVYLRSCFDFKEATGFVSLDKELAMLRAYTEIEKARFGEMLEVEIQVKDVDPEFQVPSLIVQPLAENAIYHGIMKKENGGRLVVKASMEAGQLRIEVADNGVGMKMAAGESAGQSFDGRKGVALENIRKRLFHLYGVEPVIRSVPDRGTTVVVVIPTDKGSAKR